jgi:hypothetical protein
MQRRTTNAHPAALSLVTPRAPRIRHPLGLVHGMAVEAASRPRMLRRRVLLVARRARPGLQRRRLMGAVAIAARLIRVRADGDRVQALRSVVAPHAAAGAHRQISPEAVAVLAPGRLRHADRIRRVERRHRPCVTPLAHIRRRRGERRVPVTVSARHVLTVDVHSMPRAISHLAPHPWHVRRLAGPAAATTATAATVATVATAAAVAAGSHPGGHPGDPGSDHHHAYQNPASPHRTCPP